ncbi:hypothetical protein PINS_up008045 [Pythium insidiosum]|nr:hypothetical protein PINS_up008045 [Pythium insidiosum]
MAFHRDTLTLWKKERLAHHHANYARLDAAFQRWKRVTAERKRVRQRYIAACRVGARLQQRIYLRRWRAFIIDTREEKRRRLVQAMQTTREQALVRSYFKRWRDTLRSQQTNRAFVARRSQTHSGAASVPLALSLQRKDHDPVISSVPRLTVWGHSIPIRVQHDDRTLQTSNINQPNDSNGSFDPEHRYEVELRTSCLKKIVVHHSQRQYFKRWRHMADRLKVSATLAQKITRHRLAQALKRWRVNLEATHVRRNQRQQAYFLRLVSGEWSSSLNDMSDEIDCVPRSASGSSVLPSDWSSLPGSISVTSN